MSDFSESDFSEGNDLSDDSSVRPKARARSRKEKPKAAKTSAKANTKADTAQKAKASRKTTAGAGPKTPSSRPEPTLTQPPAGPPGDGGDITRGPSVTTEAAAKKLLLAYLHQQNRPYSAIQVFDNLHKRVPKSTVEKVLTLLADDPDSLVRSKEYGKLRLFWSERANRSLPSEEQLSVLEDSTAALKVELARLQAEERGLRTELSALEADPPDSDLRQLAERLRAEEEGKRSRLGSVAAVPVDPGVMRRAVDELNYFRGSWMKRKAQCVEAVDVLAESMEKKTRETCQLLGVETDEEAGVRAPEQIRL